MTHMDYKYSLLGSPVEDYRQRPLLLQVDDAPINLFAVLEVKREPAAQRWGTLGCFRNVKLYSFLLGLAVTFLVMASYILTGDKKGLLLTPSPYHFSSPVSPGAFPLNLSSARDFANLKLVAQAIASKVEFNGTRELPDLKTLVRSEPHMFSVIPRKFLPGVKNPCWYEEYTVDITVDPYRTNLYARYSGRRVFEYLKSTLEKHLYYRKRKYYRMRCLPYFYVIGQPKCGTTDIYNILKLHPEVRFSPIKEPHWWTRKRFGIIRLTESFQERYPVEHYLDLFDNAAFQIRDHLRANLSGASSQSNITIGEASASTMWDNSAWVYFYNTTTTEGEPPFLIQDFIHALQPDARFIVMLRDPVERLYSDYLYFRIANKSAEDFHEKVSESLQLFEGCLMEAKMRSCVYNTTLNNAMPVRLSVGLYIVYILDWLTVFSRDQILVLRLEDHATNRKDTLHKVFDFLDLGPLTEQNEAEITNSPAYNTRRPGDKNLGPMLAMTKEILRDFYTPFNHQLAKVLRNDSFRWESHSKLM